MTVPKFLFGALLLAYVVYLVSLSRARPPERPPDGRLPNIVIVSVETFRADHVSALGYGRPTTPRLDEIAKQGVIFSRAYAQSSWTRPSLASTFTGTYYSTHRVETDNHTSSAYLPSLDKFISRAIPEKTITLAEFFRSRGYRCVGMTAWPQLSRVFGFGRGFDQYDLKEISDAQIVDQLSQLLTSETKTPILAFAHLDGPHYPFRPTDGTPQPIPGPFTAAMARVKAEVDSHRGDAGGGESYSEVMKAVLGSSTPEDLAPSLALYDGEIAQVDRQIGQLFKAIHESKRGRDTIIAVLGDHGEEFLEHGMIGHGMTIYEEAVHVPFLLAGPGIPARGRIDTPVQSIDLFPTLVALTGGKLPETVQGNNLLPLLKDNPGRWYPAFTEIGPLHAIVDGQMKLIVDSVSKKIELYNLAADRLENQNLAENPGYRTERDRLSAKLAAFLEDNDKRAGRNGLAPYAEIPPDLVKKLQALGYKTVDHRSDDPKTLLELGRQLNSHGWQEDAVQTLGQALELEPDNVKILIDLAKALAQAGRSDEALVHLRRAVELDPNNAVAQNNLGIVLAQKGDMKAALEQFERAARLNPSLKEAVNNAARAREMRE